MSNLENFSVSPGQPVTPDFGTYGVNRENAPEIDEFSSNHVSPGQPVTPKSRIYENLVTIKDYKDIKEINTFNISILNPPSVKTNCAGSCEDFNAVGQTGQPQIEPALTVEENQNVTPPASNKNTNQQPTDSDRRTESYEKEFFKFSKQVRNKDYIADAFPKFKALREYGVSFEDLEQAIKLFNEDYRIQADGKERKSQHFPRLTKWLDPAEAGYVSFYLEKVNEINEQAAKARKALQPIPPTESELHVLFQGEHPEYDAMMRETTKLECRRIPLKYLHNNEDYSAEIAKIEEELKIKYELYNAAFDDWKTRYLANFAASCTHVLNEIEYEPVLDQTAP